MNDCILRIAEEVVSNSFWFFNPFKCITNKACLGFGIGIIIIIVLNIFKFILKMNTQHIHTEQQLQMSKKEPLFAFRSVFANE